MDCCHCQGIEAHFDHQKAAKKIKLHREAGLRETTSMLIDAIKAYGVHDMTLLDIGGGVGAIQYELLNAGVRHVTNVEASTGYIDVAKAEAERLGLADRVTYCHGNFVELAPQIAATDIVTLDRVICCYPDMPAMVNLSATRARKLYGVVYPRTTWRSKIWFITDNIGYWWQGNPFRIFLHATKAVDAAVRRNGFTPCFNHETAMWQVVLYERTAVGSPN